MGALVRHVTGKGKGNYQPMNINFGLFGGKEAAIRDKKTRNQAFIRRALECQQQWLARLG